jgi:hypothetical protein
VLVAVGGPAAAPVWAGPPIHQVRGHGIWDLNPPRGLLNQISINAWEDETGAHGVWTWVTNFDDFNNPDGHGWIWVIDVRLLIVVDNVAYVEGPILFDNTFPEFEGAWVGMSVIDNGNGPNDPPDLLGGFPLLGGNFIVK